MGFNFGAFAGGLAKGGIDTYSTVTDIKAKQQETKRREAEWKTQDALDKAYRETYGAGDTQTRVSYGVPGAEGAKPTEYTEMDAPAVAPTVTETPYTAKQKAIDFQQKAAQYGARGIDVQKTMAGGYQLENERRTSEINQKKFELVQERNDAEAKLKGFVENKDVAGLVSHFGPALAAETGHSYALVSGPKGQTVDVLDAKGKKVDSYKADADILAKKLGPALEEHYLSKWAALDPEAALKLKASKQKDRELDIKAEDVRTSGEYRRAMAGRAGQTQGQAMNEKITALGAVYRRADPTLTVEAAEKKAAQELVKSPDARADLVTAADINKFLEANADAPEMKVKGKSGKMELRPLEERIGIARRALGGGAAAPAASGKLAQALATEGDPFAETKPEPKKTEPKKADTAIPARPEEPPRNLYLEQMAKAEAKRKALIEARMLQDAEAEREAALADERAAANRRAIGANFNALYGGTR